MRIHHLNCGSMCPAGTHLVCHCLLLERADGLVLIDTGFGTEDIRQAAERYPLRRRLGLALRAEETARQQILGLGFAVADVRHIVVTHLDADHAGALRDFPRATVWVHAAEYEAAMARASRNEQLRYQPAQWNHRPRWKLPATPGEPWFDFATVEVLDGIRFVPLFGHTRGHCGVLIERGDGWLLHAGDCFFAASEMRPRPTSPTVLSLWQRATAVNEPQARETRARLRDVALSEGGRVRLINSHDGLLLV